MRIKAWGIHTVANLRSLLLRHGRRATFRLLHHAVPAVIGGAGCNGTVPASHTTCPEHIAAAAAAACISIAHCGGTIHQLQLNTWPTAAVAISMQHFGPSYAPCMPTLGTR